MNNIPKTINDVYKQTNAFEDESKINYYAVKKRQQNLRKKNSSLSQECLE